jgi:glycosyltransferase involved in cell wall biosynthesis
MNKIPFFTVITASFNSEKTIDKTIESLLNQNYTNFEYIIIDGNSKDSTLEIIKSFEQKFKEKNITYKFISEPDKGIYDAWNKGISISRGEWISFLGSDDFYLEDALSLYYEKIQNSSGINFISSKVNLINSNFKKIRTVGVKFSTEEIIKKMAIAQIGSFHHRILFFKIGLFNTSYLIAGDYEFYLRGRNIINAGFIDKVTANMMHGGISSNAFRALKEGAEIKTRLKVTSKFSANFELYISLVKCKIKNLLGL